MVPSRHYDCSTAILGVNNFHIHKTGAQAEIVQVISDNRRQILIVCAISVAIQIGRVLAAGFV